MKRGSILGMNLWQLAAGILAIILLLTVVMPILSKTFTILLPRADSITLNNFARLESDLHFMKDYGLALTFVPYFIQSNYKLTSSDTDPACYPKSCLCLCAEDDARNSGCNINIYERACFESGTHLTFEKEVVGEQIVVLTVVRSDLDYVIGYE